MGCLLWLLRVLLMVYALLSGAVYYLIGDSDYFWHGMIASCSLLIVSLFGRYPFSILIALALIVGFALQT